MAVLAYLIPGEVVVGGFSLLTGLMVGLVIGVARLRERVARLEEWVRVREIQNHRDRSD